MHMHVLKFLRQLHKVVLLVTFVAMIVTYPCLCRESRPLVQLAAGKLHYFQTEMNASKDVTVAILHNRLLYCLP